MKACLKWAGGKRALLPELRKRLPSSYGERTHIEPFAGGAALAFDLAPDRVQLSDACKPLIAFYRELRRDAPAVVRSARALASHYGEAHYYATRKRFNLHAGQDHTKYSTASQAARFYYLNHGGFNGLMRMDRQGRFNVPYGRRRKITVDGDALRECGELLKRSASLSICPYQASMPGWGSASSSTFVYLDPPYPGTFDGYAGRPFGYEDHIALRDWADGQARLGSAVMVSIESTAFSREVWGRLGWRTANVKARRSISCNGDRAKAGELILTSYGAAA